MELQSRMPAALVLARRKARIRLAALLLAVFLAPFAAFQQHALPPPIARAVGRLYFWPTIWLTYLRSWLSGKGLWCSIDNTVVLGVAPLALFGHPEALNRLGVCNIVNMQDEYAGPQAAYRRLGLSQLRLPTVDHVEPELAKLVEAVQLIEQCRKRGERVYVHCKAGHGRAGAVVLAWLAYSRGVTDAAGLAKLNAELLAKRRVRAGLHSQPQICAFASWMREAVSEQRATEPVVAEQAQSGLLGAVAVAPETLAAAQDTSAAARPRTMSEEALAAEAEAAAELAAAIAEAEAAEAEAAAEVEPNRPRTMSEEALAAESEAAAELAAAIAEAEVTQAEAAQDEAGQAKIIANVAPAVAAGVDSELARRLSIQREKEENGESGTAQQNSSRRSIPDGKPVVNDELAARLQRQKLKEETGESAVDAVGRQVQSPAREVVIDSQLNERLQRQKQKEQTGASAVDSESAIDAVDRREHSHVEGVVDSELAAKLNRQKLIATEVKAATVNEAESSQLSPQTPMREREEKRSSGVSPGPVVGGFDAGLAARLQRQREKEQTGESAVHHIQSHRHAAEAEGIDAGLAARLQRQKEKEQTGESAVFNIQSHRHVAEAEGIDSGLAALLQRQKEKEQTGESAVHHIQSHHHIHSGAEAEAIDPQLAARLERQKQKEQSDESAAGIEQPDPGPARESVVPLEEAAEWQLAD